MFWTLEFLGDFFYILYVFLNFDKQALAKENSQKKKKSFWQIETYLQIRSDIGISKVHSVSNDITNIT